MEDSRQVPRQIGRSENDREGYGETVRELEKPSGAIVVLRINEELIVWRNF